MDKFKKLVTEIMAECEADGETVTREEAEEMAKMEIGAKQIKRYEKSDNPKPRAPRERKVDVDKANLINEVIEMLRNCNIEITEIKTGAEIKFSYNNNDYTFKLIKHRLKK